jgi:hypothetical protein
MKGHLNPEEPHPAAYSAAKYILSLGVEKLSVYMAAFSSCAIEDNRLGEICAETLSRLLKGKAVSDRYLLGLVWTIKTMEEENANHRPNQTAH